MKFDELVSDVVKTYLRMKEPFQLFFLAVVVLKIIGRRRRLGGSRRRLLKIFWPPKAVCQHGDSTFVIMLRLYNNVYTSF